MMKHQLKRLSPPSTQSGFTIIESLLAILIVTALLVAIAPVITLSVATRLQARRVEQATQAARTYIDGVRSGKIAPPERVRVLDEVAGPLGNERFNPDRERFSDTPPPPRTITIRNCRSTGPDFPYCINQPQLSLYCADFDGDGDCSNRSTTDLIVQAFRSRTTDPSDNDGSKGYLLGVRVYRAAAFNGSTEFQTTVDMSGKKVATNTGGRGDYRPPLVEMTTEVQSKPDEQARPEKQYEDFCDRLGGCQ